MRTLITPTYVEDTNPLTLTDDPREFLLMGVSVVLGALRDRGVGIHHG